MPFKGFEGPAGTGKTHHLIQAVLDQVVQNPLAPHQRVLALTFMHGSRRRLDERFSAIAAFQRRYTCVTIDSFAAHLARRWKTLCEYLEIDTGDFEHTCDCGGRLLEEDLVARWVAATHPVVAVDEAQELSPARLRIVRALVPHAALFVAADEFQCLDEMIDTGPFVEWFATGQITSLQRVHRTARQGLLAAATALRNGSSSLINGTGLRITYSFPNQAPFSIGHALHNGLARGGDVAVIVAPGAKDWIDPMLPRFREGLQTPRQTVLPLRIGWEIRPDDEVARIVDPFRRMNAIPASNIVETLEVLHDPPPWVRMIISAVRHQQNACGQSVWSAESFQNLVERRAALHRAYSYYRPKGIPVTSIHGAKNRQFRHVVVLWPHGVRGDATQQRRLLYNAITRAQESCTVFVRGRDLLNAPPFSSLA